MDIAYRLYLGARNSGRRRFSRRDLAVVEALLDEHFHGWTTAKATGRWKGRTEEALVITFTSQGVKPVAKTAKAAVKSCVRRLKDYLGQESVMLEEGGAVDLW